LDGLTSSSNSSNSVSNLEIGHVFADFFYDAGIVAASNRSWRRPVLESLPVCGIQRDRLGFHKDPILCWEFGERNVSRELCDALGLVNDSFLSRHVEDGEEGVVGRYDYCSWF
jgi:hypothetical protein